MHLTSVELKSKAGKAAPHAGWVRSTHWVSTISFLLLVFSGAEILMVHPRLYWGEVGNELTHAWIELPISRNYQHGGWEEKEAFSNVANSPATQARSTKIFNLNSWGRSLHFMAGWGLVSAGTVYLVLGCVTGHFWRNLIPRAREIRLHAILG